ncbi:MAG: transglycosylase SLT domain-containing protein [Bdellovibrionaceae bacterium]|nr:transglycosylase SLT domain-containing protein [Bdellovibrio sp.]
MFTKIPDKLKVVITPLNWVMVFLLVGHVGITAAAKKKPKRPRITTELKLSPRLMDLKPEAEQLLNDFFKLKMAGENDEAVKKLGEWHTASPEQTLYKEFFLAQIQQSPEQFWKLYLSLKKEKKLLRLQLESLKQILDITSQTKTKFPLVISDFKRESKITLKKFGGLPEGLDFELQFLKWIQTNGVTEELCQSERQRWLAQTTMPLNEVMAALNSCPMKFNDFTYRTRLLIFSGQEKKAQKEVDEYIKLEKLKDWEKAYLQAIFFSNIGDPTAAFQIVKKFEPELLASKDYYDNLFYIAQRAGELDKAEEIVNKIIAQVPSLVEKKEFIFQKAFLFYQTKRYKEAIVLLDSLIKNNSSHGKKRKRNDYDDLTWLRAWCYYLNKDYSAAKEAFIENKKWTRDLTRNVYWLAQAEWKLENQQKALDYFKHLAQPLIKGEFFNYYNLLAWVRYETLKGEVNNEAFRAQLSKMRSGRGQYVLPDDISNPLRILQEYRTYFSEINTTDEGDIQVVNQDNIVAGQSDVKAISVDNSAELKKEINWSEHLILWGYPDFAKWHLFEVEKALRNRQSAELLIQHYLDKKYYYRALSLMQKVTSPQQKKLSLKDDELLWKSLYPQAYNLSVQSESGIRKINPYLIWSIMKAETQFKSDAISPVGAVGLMQFMPYTSYKVANLLREDHEVKHLFEPDQAVKFGAMYLKKLSIEFNNQLPLIASAYNGGPHRVKLWLRNLGDIDFDVFVEHIPFAETRTYVKRVLSFHTTYEKIYDEKLDAKKFQWMIEKNQYKLAQPISLKEEWDFPIH